MALPVHARDKVPYRWKFLDGYEPNVDSLLPARLADTLDELAGLYDGNGTLLGLDPEDTHRWIGSGRPQ